MKRKLNIGDRFLSWTVIKCEDQKKYRYLCRCDCGNEKSFYKYHLLSGKYACCKNCGHYSIQNMSLIKKHWNYELNEAFLSRPQTLELGKAYWFICDNGHNFKSDIKDFSLDRCMSCKSVDRHDASKDKIFEYCKQLFEKMFGHCDAGEYYINVAELKATIVFREKFRDSSIKSYYASEDSYLKDVDSMTNLKKACKDKGFQFFLFKTEKNFLSNVDNLDGVVIELSHSENNSQPL